MGDYLDTSTAIDALGDMADALYDDDGSIDTVAVAADIDRAEGVMNAYIGNRYVVPVTGGDAGLLEELALALFTWIAHRRSPAAEIPKHIAAAHADAVQTLRDIGAGRATLGGAEAPQEQTAVADSIVITNNPGEFDRPNMTGF